jgi:nicotinamide mononucleotide adenylyltransferase
VSSKNTAVKKSSIMKKTYESEIEQDTLMLNDESGSTSAIKVKSAKRITPVKKQSVPVKKFTEPKKVINLEEKHSQEEKVISENPTIERLKLEALGKKYEEKSIKNSEPSNGNNNSVYSIAELEQLNVHKLRRYARSFDGFPIKGREISKANRGELLNYFKDLI